jgi:hypothetical protein
MKSLSELLTKVVKAYKGSKRDCTLCDTEEEKNFTSFIERLQ